MNPRDLAAIATGGCPGGGNRAHGSVMIILQNFPWKTDMMLKDYKHKSTSGFTDGG
jgi:hypothetical protein